MFQRQPGKRLLFADRKDQALETWRSLLIPGESENQISASRKLETFHLDQSSFVFPKSRKGV